MKLKIQQDELNKALVIAMRAVSTSSYLPILGHFKLEVADGLTVTANALDMAISVNVPAEVEEAGAITVPARLFSDYVKTLQDGEEIMLQMDDGTKTLQVQSERDTANIKGMDADEFPQTPSGEGASFEFFPASLDSMVKQVVYAVASEQSRPILMCVYTVIKGKTLRLATADGFRLAECTRLVEELSSVDEPVEALIPAKAWKETMKIAKYYPEESIELIVITGGEQAVFKVGPVIISSKTEPGEYPNYTGIIPAPFDEQALDATRVAVNTKDFETAVKVADLFGEFVSLEVDVNAGLVVVKARNVDGEDSVGDIEADCQGQKIEIGVGGKYLLDFLGAVKTERVVVEMTGPARPLLLTPSGDDSCRAVIMPMSVH